LIREIKLPGGTAGGFSGKKKEKTFISLYKLHHTGFYFSLDTQTGTSVVYENQSRFQYGSV
jgi:hypothetical protein